MLSKKFFLRKLNKNIGREKYQLILILDERFGQFMKFLSGSLQRNISSIFEIF